MQTLSFFSKTSLLLALSLSVSTARAETAQHPVKPEYGDYQNWSLLAVSHRLDKKTLRAILGNSEAISAARQNKTNPWPDGAILAKVVWKESTHPSWPQAIVPGEFEKAEAMIKDSKKYAATGGWGFAYWKGKNLIIHTEEKAKECFACHTTVKQNDYVFNTSALQ